MRYRKLGSLDIEVSALGFGCMRLPTRDGEIDEPEAMRMLHYAINRGVNYLDTAYPYHNGQSEIFLGRALQGGYRDKVYLATKMPSWLVKTADDFDRFLDEQLARLQTDQLDFYLLHALNRGWWHKLRDLGVIAWAEKAIADGRFKYLGFSFHDDYDVFQSIIDDYDHWALAQVQYNLIDVENQAGTRGVQYAAAKGVAVVVMEPLLGGKLVDPPQPVQAIWDEAMHKRSAVDWALQWLWDQPEVSTVLSGMSTMPQMEENLASADASGVGILGNGNRPLFERVRARYKALMPIGCTGCRYCMPCPQGVDIPVNLGIYNEGVMYGKPDAARGQYDWFRQAFEVVGTNDHDIRALQCVQCGACEEKCPQKIPISRWMQTIHQVLGEGQPFVMQV